MSQTKVYHKFDLPKDKGIKCDPKEAKTHQSFKEECDINNIVEHYTKTGNWSTSLRPATRPPIFGDFTSVPDFREAMNYVANAREQFEALPSRIRKRFENDPGQLLSFLQDEKNRPEAEALGLIEAKSATVAAASPAPTVAQSPEAK